MAEFDVEYDVVVIGAGASGKSAAYIVATESDNSCVVLEKCEQTGGTAVYAEGTCASESSEQRARQEKGIIDYPGRKPAPEGAHYPTHEEHVKRYMNYSHYRANFDIARAFVWNSAETIEIYKELGINYTDVTIYAYDQPEEIYTFHRPEGLGAHCQEVLERACINNGVDFFTSTPAKDLIIEDGKVVGVIADSPDGEIKIGTKAVIMAAGGFGNSTEKIEKYSWIPDMAKNNMHIVPTENTGDSIDMALKAGGVLRDCDVMQIAPAVPDHMIGTKLQAAAMQPNLWLNLHGKRFINEDICQAFANCGTAIALTDGGRVWSIFDQKQLEYMIENGSDIGLGDFIVINKPIDPTGEITESIAAGDPAVKKADTLEDLIKAIGVPFDTAMEEIREYNDTCGTGKDSRYFKASEFMRPIENGPFYAIMLGPSIICTDGGIRVNENFQVVDDDYKPVLTGNLYAVGNDATCLFGDTYNLDCPGTTNGLAHTSGRIAARHAIKTI